VDLLSGHPALPFDTHIALTLRELRGLTTEETAVRFLSGSLTTAQSIVRAGLNHMLARVTSGRARSRAYE
jgi:predicted RNA polymerase sigma factor